jgi:hypothetical protein
MATKAGPSSQVLPTTPNLLAALQKRAGAVDGACGTHASAPAPGPTSLAELQKGAVVDGDCGSDPHSLPPWWTATCHARFAKTQPWFRLHAFTVTLFWHVSLVIGFSLGPLLDALVFTGSSFPTGAV